MKANSTDCVFCEIVAGSRERRLHYEDEKVAVFDNQLTWVPVMLLLIPKQHMTQAELWTDGDMVARLGKLAVKFGQELCPNGFRILSNFGADAFQTQPHGHIHVIGGRFLGRYVQ